MNDIEYLALGDSYTIGESVPPENNFPHQLAGNLKKSGLDIGKPYIIAKTGWTTSELQAAIRAAGLKQKFSLVTLLIGVNNQYRGEPAAIYRKEFRELLQTAIDFADGKPSRVFVVSIPDWGATPFGLVSGREQQLITSEIDTFNAINKNETLLAGANYTDITAGSREAARDPGLVAADGLHPSARMYLNWAARVAALAVKVLK